MPPMSTIAVGFLVSLLEVDVDAAAFAEGSGASTRSGWMGERKTSK